MLINGDNFKLTISYVIPKSGIYEYDILAKELAGEFAKETDWGSVMFRSRIISYKFPTKLALDMAIEKFSEEKIFKILT